MAGYLEHHAAIGWAGHYFSDRYSSAHLAVDPAWWAAHLPAGFKGFGNKDGTEWAFRVQYRDRTDGKLYEARMWVAWDDYDRVYFHDELDQYLGEAGPVKGLQGYFYNEHHCPCHRKQDAAAAGAVTDDACEGDRFPIVKVWDPNHPTLILYSETMTVAELEAHLTGSG